MSGSVVPWSPGGGVTRADKASVSDRRHRDRSPGWLSPRSWRSRSGRPSDFQDSHAVLDVCGNHYATHYIETGLTFRQWLVPSLFNLGLRGRASRSWPASWRSERRYRSAACGGNSRSGFPCCPQSCPTIGGSFHQKIREYAGRYGRKNPLVTVGCCTSSVPIGWVIGGGGGNRTRVHEFSARSSTCLVR